MALVDHKRAIRPLSKTCRLHLHRNHHLRIQQSYFYTLSSGSLFQEPVLKRALLSPESGVNPIIRISPLQTSALMVTSASIQALIAGSVVRLYSPRRSLRMRRHHHWRPCVLLCSPNRSLLSLLKYNSLQYRSTTTLIRLAKQAPHLLSHKRTSSCG